MRAVCCICAIVINDAQEKTKAASLPSLDKNLQNHELKQAYFLFNSPSLWIMLLAERRYGQTDIFLSLLRASLLRPVPARGRELNSDLLLPQGHPSYS